MPLLKRVRDAKKGLAQAGAGMMTEEMLRGRATRRARRCGLRVLWVAVLTVILVMPARSLAEAGETPAPASPSTSAPASADGSLPPEQGSSEAQPLSLLDAVRIALAQNLGLKANRLDFESQRLQRQQAREAFGIFPTVSATATDTSGSASSQSYALTVTRKDVLGGTAALKGTVSEAQSPRSVSSVVDLSYSLSVLEQGGSAFVRLPLTRAEINYALQEISFWEQTQATALNAVNAFLNAWTAAQELRVREATLQQAKTTYEGDLLKFELGVINVPDRARSELNYLNAEASYLTAERALKDALQNLAVVLGYPPSQPLQVAEVLAFTLPELPDRASLFSERLKFNPTLRRQELLKRLQELSVFEARRRLLPEGSLTFGYSLTSSGNTWGLGTRLDSWSVRAGFAINLPLNTVQDRLAYRVAQNNYAAFMVRYEETRRNTIQQLEAQWRAIEELQKRLTVLQKSLESARLSYTLIQEAYQEGLQRFLDFQIAQQQYQEAQLREQQARASLLRAVVQFYRDFGYEVLPMIEKVVTAPSAPEQSPPAATAGAP